MNYIVMDLEWNQAPTASLTLQKPLKLKGEIVQIGAVKLDECFRVTESFKSYIRPRFYKKMHSHVKRLTGISSSDLSKSEGFDKVAADFIKWCGSDHMIFTWGPDDEGMFRDNLIVNKMPKELLKTCFNLQLIFDDQITRENRQFSLSFALEKVGESLEDAHDALGDAMGTAKLLKHLDMKKGLTDYPELFGRVTPPSLFVKELKKTYRSQKQALADTDASLIEHPIADGMIRCGEYRAASRFKHFSLAKDEKGTDYFVCLKFCRKEEAFSASLTVHLLNQKLLEQYKSLTPNTTP